MSNTSEKDEELSLEERVANLERRLAELEKVAGETRTRPTGAGGAISKKLSLKEFILDKGPENTRETTLAVSYYLEMNDGVAPFNVQDLERSFRSAKIPPPKNINDMVNKNVQRGLLMEAAEKKNGRKAWEITATGERVVEKGFAR